MMRLNRLRLFEIGVALLLTVAALVFVGLTIWAAQPEIVRITDAWASSDETGKGLAAFMTITNRADADDVLKTVRSSKGDPIEIHQAMMTPKGVMQVRKLEHGLSIPGRGTLKMKPGGTHLMLFGLEEAMLAGEEVMLTLEFQHGGVVNVRLPINSGDTGKGVVNAEAKSSGEPVPVPVPDDNNDGGPD